MLTDFGAGSGSEAQTQYGSKKVFALRGVNLEVEPGETVGVLGENGAGKTTLLRILSTLLAPTSGVAKVAGYSVETDAKRIRDHIVVVFGGERGLFGRLTGRENLDFFGVLRGLPSAYLRKAIPPALERVGLSEASNRRVETYSRGMRQRLHLAAGTLIHPPILLLDEPTTGLDPAEAMRTRGLIKEVAREGTTIVLTSHLLQDIESLCDRIILLRSGSILHDVSVADFMLQGEAVAVVRLVCTVDPTSLRLERLGRMTFEKGSDGRYAAHIQVAAWTADVLSGLASLAESDAVVAIQINRMTLEDVYQNIAIEDGR